MKKLSWRDAIKHVLEEAGEALSRAEIVEQIMEERLVDSTCATPAQQVSWYLNDELKHKGENAFVVRIGHGQYISRSALEKNKTDETFPKSDNNQSEVIPALGMFWQKDFISWMRNPKLLGAQADGAAAVNFCEQIGLYLLYDGREVIYAGRTTDRPLGQRLYEHTKDRLATRWNRFSWFGLRDVSDEGELMPLPQNYSIDKIIPALEAILIEALEPRQNRKRGDDLSTVEYMQVKDPELEKEFLKQTWAKAGKQLGL